MTQPLRVFQVASGNVGTEMVKRIVKHPGLQLVGLHCYSPDKIGRDAGDIIGIGPIGVTATGTIDDILAARPDCLTFHGVWPDMELYERGRSRFSWALLRWSGLNFGAGEGCRRFAGEMRDAHAVWL